MRLSLQICHLPLLNHKTAMKQSNQPHATVCIYGSGNYSSCPGASAHRHSSRGAPPAWDWTQSRGFMGRMTHTGELREKTNTPVTLLLSNYLGTFLPKEAWFLSRSKHVISSYVFQFMILHSFRNCIVFSTIGVWNFHNAKQFMWLFNMRYKPSWWEQRAMPILNTFSI